MVMKVLILVVEHTFSSENLSEKLLLNFFLLRLRINFSLTFFMNHDLFVRKHPYTHFRHTFVRMYG